MKYRYIIIQGDTDYYNLITQKTKDNKEAIVISGLFEHYPPTLKLILMQIYRFAYKIECKTLLQILARNMFDIKLNSNEKICFLIWSWYANDVNDYLGEYLRLRYKGSRIVCRFEDIIEKMPYKNFDEYKMAFDYLLSFDEIDAQKYKIDYFPSWYDKYDLKEKGAESDVLFVGRGKDRLSDIYDVFNELDSNGVNCLFYLVDVPKEERRYEDKIIYGNQLPYKKVLSLVNNTKCLLEIVQKDAISETLRVFEAIAYNKRLLTNNIKILERDYYSPQYIQYYENTNDICVDFILNNQIKIKYDDKFLERLRPINMLNFIDTKFEDC